MAINGFNLLKSHKCTAMKQHFIHLQLKFNAMKKLQNKARLKLSVSMKVHVMLKSLWLMLQGAQLAKY